jgi:hypothetical protein
MHTPFARCLFCVLPLVMTAATAAGAELSGVRVAEGGAGFQLAETGQPFTPFGFNYDHDPGGTLLEDYWETEWDTVVEDFREMRALGANTVRVHLQFGKFMNSPTEPNAAALARLKQLVKLAEGQELYLDVTGLGCYHKADVPAWYDRLSESDRWGAQANFWRAVARTCAESPSIFCYDLMNEPVVPGGSGRRDDWLGPAFAGKHFVQFVALETAGRDRPEIARQWVRTLVSAIREVDSHHLITVGLVPWSLDRPGLTSGFVPAQIVDDLDFLCVHLYPEAGKVDEALETLRGFALGKPVVIEEMFPLKSSLEEMSAFMDRSRDVAAGWISFYWGQSPTELEQQGTLTAGVMRAWLREFCRRGPDSVDIP